MKIALYLLTILILFTSCASRMKMSLNDFVYEQKDLPEKCRIKVAPEGRQLPCDATQNPFISGETSFLVCFMERITTDNEISSQVINALFSVYESTKEIGVFGFELKSEDAALELKSQILENKSYEGHGNIYQKNKFVIILWADQITDPIFPEFEKLIEKTIENMN